MEKKQKNSRFHMKSTVSDTYLAITIAAPPNAMIATIISPSRYKATFFRFLFQLSIDSLLFCWPTKKQPAFKRSEKKPQKCFLRWSEY